jgi:hypothetical protein
MNSPRFACDQSRFGDELASLRLRSVHDSTTYEEGQDGVCQQTGASAVAKRRDKGSQRANGEASSYAAEVAITGR